MTQKTTHLDYTFIETLPGESEGAWKRAVEEMLTNLFDPPQTNWWYPFTIGPVVQWSGRSFRSFRCVAGSVTAHLLAVAMRGGLPRALIVLGGQHAHVWCQGQNTVCDGNEIASQLSTYTAKETGREQSRLTAKAPWWKFW